MFGRSFREIETFYEIIDLIENFQADEKFFAVAAAELRKVELFYNEKLADALRKLHELQRELDGFEKVGSHNK